MVSELAGAKRQAFPAASPEMRHLLSPPLCTKEVLLGSQQHGGPFLKAAPFSTTLHPTPICKLSLAHPHCTGSQGSPSHPPASSGPLPSQLPSPALGPDHSWPSWAIPDNHQLHTYVQTTHL